MLCPYCEYGMVLRAKIKDLDKKYTFARNVILYGRR